LTAFFGNYIIIFVLHVILSFLLDLRFLKYNTLIYYYDFQLNWFDYKDFFTEILDSEPSWLKNVKVIPKSSSRVTQLLIYTSYDYFYRTELDIVASLLLFTLFGI